MEEKEEKCAKATYSKEVSSDSSGSSAVISIFMFAATVPVMVRIPPITMISRPHEDVQPVWMKIATEAKASMLEAIVASCGVAFFVVYKCMTMLTQTKIAVACAIRLIVAKVDVDANGSEDPVNAEGRLKGKYICDPANWLHGRNTEAKFNDAPARIM